MASSPIQPSNYTFPVNWPMITPRRRFHPPSSPAQPPPKSFFRNKLPPGTTTITRLKGESYVGIAPAPFKLGKLAPNHQSPPPRQTSTATFDKLAPNCHRDYSTPPPEIVGFDRKSSPTAAFSGCGSEITGETRRKQEQGEKEKENKRKFSLLLTEEQIAQDILAAKTLAAGRSSSDGNNNNNYNYRRYVRQGNRQRRKSSSCQRRQGFSFRVSKEEIEQDLGPGTDRKLLQRAMQSLTPALKLGFY